MRPATRTLMLVALAATSAIAVGRTLQPSSHRPHTAERPVLVVVPRDATQFGRAWEDQRFTWVLPLTNPSGETVRVTDVSAACTCVSVEPRALTLAPGTSGQIKLVLDLAPREHETAGVQREFSSEVSFTTASDTVAAGRERVVVKGTVRPVLDVRPRDPSFGPRSSLVQPPLPLSFTVVPNTPLETLTAVCDVVGFAADVKDAGANALRVTVTPTRSRPEGPIELGVRLIPVRPGGEALPERRVVVRGSVVPDLATDPPQVTFAGRPVGESNEEVVALRSLAGRAVVAESVRATGDGVSAELTPDGAVRVKLAAVRPGQVTGRVDVRVKAGGAGATVSVPVTGYATGAGGNQGGQP